MMAIIVAHVPRSEGDRTRFPDGPGYVPSFPTDFGNLMFHSVGGAHRWWPSLVDEAFARLAPSLRPVKTPVLDQTYRLVTAGGRDFRHPEVRPEAISHVRIGA